MKTACRLIRDLRSELGLSQTEFAKDLGISQSNLSKIENGKLFPPLSAFLMACRFTCTTKVSEKLFQRFCAQIWGKTP